MRALTVALLVAIHLQACTPMRQWYAPSDAETGPSWLEASELEASGLDDGAFLARDGRQLHVRRWPIKTGGEPTTVVIALHGLNDHSGRFGYPAAAWSDQGIFVYAYDQRGFGENALENLWPGSDALVNDLLDFTKLVAGRHPSVPIVLLGESMGGAVILSALGGSELPPEVKRAVLVAPAVRGREALGPFLSGGLWLMAHLLPGYAPSTEDETFELSDDEALTEALIADPGYRKSIRIDSVYGLVGLMDQAVAAAPRLDRPALVIYGGQDNLVPVSSVRQALRVMPEEMTVNCFRPYSGHLLFHEKLGPEDGRPAMSPEPVWKAAAHWMVTQEQPEICK